MRPQVLTARMLQLRRSPDAATLFEAIKDAVGDACRHWGHCPSPRPPVVASEAVRHVSAWQLHLDELEVRAFNGDWEGVPSCSVVEIAGSRILEELHRLWRPSSGSVYESFSAQSGRFWGPSTEKLKRWVSKLERNAPTSSLSSRAIGNRTGCASE